MTFQEAKRLLVGTVVMWDGDRDDLGTVRKVDDTAFYVDWENGQSGWIDHYDAEKIAIR